MKSRQNTKTPTQTKRYRTLGAALGIAALLCIAAGTSSLLYGWGVWGHQHISHAAVFALPPEMRTMFFNHIDYITEESSIPDVRKYTKSDRDEYARHFIDVEFFGDKPFETLPKTWKEAKAKYSTDTLQKAGILPWYMQEMQAKLTTAFKDRKRDAILFLAGDIAHYIADAHMPLHTSLNHDGQLTDQRGIHSFWEARLPELFGKDYNFNVGDAKYIADPVAESWRIIRESNATADTLLAVERKLKTQFTKEQIWQLDSNKNIKKNQFGQSLRSLEYAKAYHAALNGMVERQMRASIAATANFWYTAWVNAGKPNITDLDSEATIKRNKPLLEEEIELWKKGKLFDFKSYAEY
jgi:hypothetical protein